MNTEGLNNYSRILWSREGSQRRTPRSQFERGEFVRRFIEQLAFDNRIVSPYLRSGLETIEDVAKEATSRTLRLVVNEDGASLAMTYEEYQSACKENSISA